jgi:sarcosine oxidase subunit alpha
MKRLPAMPDEWIDRSTVVRFRFEGRSFEGLRRRQHQPALWAPTCASLGRSFKYHRPRGMLSRPTMT